MLRNLRKEVKKFKKEDSKPENKGSCRKEIKIICEPRKDGRRG